MPQNTTNSTRYEIPCAWRRTASAFVAFAMASTFATRATAAEPAEPTRVDLTTLHPSGGLDRAGKPPIENGKAFLNADAKGQPLNLAGDPVPGGLYLAESQLSLEYPLDGAYSGFTARVGIPRESQRNRGPVRLQVLADGRTVFETAVEDPASVVPIVADVTGAQRLMLVSTVMASEATAPKVDLVIAEPQLIPLPQPDKETLSPDGMTAVIKASPSDGNAPLTVAFDATGSNGPDGVGRYTWWFGDGATETLTPTPSHAYAEPGVYSVLLEVTDEAGRIGRSRQTITVNAPGNRPPTAQIAVSKAMANPGETLEFDASGSSDRDGTITAYEWAFSDGQTASGPIATVRFENMGAIDVTLTVTDDGGTTTSTKRRVRIDDGSFASVLPIREGSRILFIGNSLTAFWGPLHKSLEAMTQASTPSFSITTDNIGKGIGMLVEYATWPSLGIEKKIQEGWDVVIIQAYKDAIPGKYEESGPFEESAATLVRWCRESAAYPVLWMPHLHWFSWPEDFPAARDRTQAVANKLNCVFVESYPAWNRVLAEHPMPVNSRGWFEKSDDPESWQQVLFADTVHQNGKGMLLNTAILYKFLTGQSPVGLRPQWPKGLANSRVRFDPERQDYFFRIADETTPAFGEKQP